MAEAIGRRTEPAGPPPEEPAGGPGWSIDDVSVADIHDRRWRGDVDVADAAYRALCRSIDELGIIRPLLLRPRPQGGYELVSGARRLRAARERGWPAVPAVVRELSEVEALVGGAWQPLMRSGCTEPEATALRDELIAAGISAAEAEALTAILGFRAPGEGPGGSEAAAGRQPAAAEPEGSKPSRPATTDPVTSLAGRPAWAWSTQARRIEPSSPGTARSVDPAARGGDQGPRIP
jgi:ParB/Sulfiredoxin domain